MASDERAPVVAIVGAGSSGTLVASPLLRRACRPRLIPLIDRSDPFAAGLALARPTPATC